MTGTRAMSGSPARRRRNRDSSVPASSMASSMLTSMMQAPFSIWPRAMRTASSVLPSKFDVVIANTGAAWAEQHAALLERSNAALFLVDQRASSIRACKHALELCARCGIATGPFKFAINRCAKGAPLTSIDVSCALRGVPVFELRDGGPDVEELLGAGSPAELLKARNEFCTSLEQLFVKVLPDSGGRKGSLEPTVASREEKRRGRHAGRKWGRRKP